MMTTVFQDVNPACIGDASTGPLLAVVVSDDGFDIHKEFQTFKDAYRFPSAIEPERDEYGETGPGIVTPEHAAATSAAVDRAMADVRGPSLMATLPNGWSSYPGVTVLFISWLAQRPEIVVETALHHFTTPIYRSTVPTWTLEDADADDLYEEDAIGFDSDRGASG
jgi:hypothetical protein